MTGQNPREVARRLIERYGDRAGPIASDRRDDAKTYATAYLYERVIEYIRHPDRLR